MGKNLSIIGLGLALLGVSLTGCGHQNPSPTSEQGANPAPKADPLADQYKKLRTADYQVDGAIQEIDDAMEASKALAPKAGGDAEKALSSVADLLDGAGESLGDYEPVADTFDEFKKDFAAQDERRIRVIKVTNESLGKIGDASDILNDLAANAPDQYKKNLGAIIDNVDQAQSDLEQAVPSMGGQLPDDSDSESVDPVQEKGKSP